MPSRSSSTWKRAGSRATRAAAHPGGLERGGHGGGDEPARLTVFPHAQSTGGTLPKPTREMVFLVFSVWVSGVSGVFLVFLVLEIADKSGENRCV